MPVVGGVRLSPMGSIKYTTSSVCDNGTRGAEGSRIAVVALAVSRGPDKHREDISRDSPAERDPQRRSSQNEGRPFHGVS